MESEVCAFLLETRDPSQILTKALVILEHQVTKHDVERQLKIINQYIIVSKDGFLVRDLGNLMRLFELLKTRINDARFENLLVALLDLCFIPPKIMKSSDVLVYALDIQQFFSWLGYMVVWLTNKDLQQKILNTLYKLLTKDCPNKRNCLSLAVRKEKAQSSILVEIFGDLLEIVDNVIYALMLKVVQILMKDSKKTCIELLKKGVVNSIIVRLEPKWKQRFPSLKPALPTGEEEVFHTELICQVLTLLLQHASSDTMRAPTKFSLWSLQWMFRYFCIKETAVIQRNNILGILLLLMEIYPDLLSGNLTLCYDIAMLAMSGDIIFNKNWTIDVKLTTSNEDHNFMALLLMCISYFPNCLSGPKTIEECRVVMGLLKLIGHQQNIKWNRLQACYLIRLALNILHKIVPASAEDFIEDGGPLTIIQLLNRSRESRNSYNYDIVFRSMELLSHLSFKFTSIRDSVAYNGGVNCMIPLLEDYLEQRYLSIPNQSMLAVGICLLEQICTETEVYLVLPMIFAYMKRYIEPNKEDPVQNPKLIIIVLSFLWNKVALSDHNSELFVDKGGVYLILDVLQISSLSVRLVALGALIDLCERVECIPFLITWRKDGRRIKSLLIDIFRQENKELDVKTDRNGIIADPEIPIMGSEQFYETFCICGQSVGNPSIGDMFVSCRAKVYCLLQILNSKQRETVEVVDEFYKLYEEDLSAQDEITLLLAENYLALKLAEEWKELDKEFKKMGLEPIPSDDAIITAMIQITNQWGSVLQHMQQEVLLKHQIKESHKERDLYTTLRNSKLSDAWNAICLMKYIARCSERLFRISSNFNLQSQIDKSLVINKENGQMHRTLPSKISISCFQNQTVDVPTDVGGKTDSFVAYGYSPVQSQASFSLLDHSYDESEYIPQDKFLSECIRKSSSKCGNLNRKTSSITF